MPISDERLADEDIQPGDTVIEMQNGKPVVYTEPGGYPNASVRKARAATAKPRTSH